MSSTLRTTMAEVRLENNYLLRIKLVLDDELTLEILKEHNEQVMAFVGERRFAILFDMCDVSLFQVSTEVMRYQAHNEYSKFQVGLAVLVKNQLLRQTVNFFIRVFRPSVPTRLFSQEQEALVWLQMMATTAGIVPAAAS